MASKKKTSKKRGNVIEFPRPPAPKKKRKRAKRKKKKKVLPQVMFRQLSEFESFKFAKDWDEKAASGDYQITTKTYDEHGKRIYSKEEATARAARRKEQALFRKRKKKAETDREAPIEIKAKDVLEGKLLPFPKKRRPPRDEDDG